MSCTTTNKLSLFLIGGNAKSVLDRYVELAGGNLSHIAIVTFASAEPEKSGNGLKARLLKRGAARVTVLLPGSDSIPDDVTSIYLGGGRQSRLVEQMPPGMLAQIRQLRDAGCLIAGSSAGAAAMAPEMIAGGMKDGILAAGSLTMRTGLNLLPGTVIDTHYRERARFLRLHAAVGSLPSMVGIGLDEDTALEIFGNLATVVGRGQVMLVQSETDSATDIGRLESGKRASVWRFPLSCLAAGQAFELLPPDAPEDRYLVLRRGLNLAE